MQALNHDNVPSTLPKAASARLAGHEGPVQIVRFTREFMRSIWKTGLALCLLEMRFVVFVLSKLLNPNFL
jgi:hypothetical protein